MAFACTIGGDTHGDLLRVGGDTVILFPVGEDPARGLFYSMSVGLSPLPTNLEYFFNVIEVVNGGGERSIFDSAEVCRIVDKESRVQILDGLLRATKYLLINEKPKRFIMNTFVADLPEKAMVKYYMLCQLFVDCGYDVTRANSYHGRHQWWADRRD